jgi:hypothetical protein
VAKYQLKTLTALIDEDHNKKLNYYSIPFPERWESKLGCIYNRHSKYSNKKYLPIKSLNEVLAAKYPEIISFNSGKNKKYSWLLSKKKIDVDELFYNYISTWILKSFSKKASKKELLELIKTFSSDDLKWQEKEVKLLSDSVNSNGTYNPNFDYYKLIPDYFIDRLKNKTLKINGMNFKFKKAGEELISWPPEKVEFKNHEEFYSFALKIEPKTLPHFDKPVIQINPSFKRWVSLPIQYENDNSNLKWYSNATVYFEANKFDNKRSDLIKTELRNQKYYHKWKNYHIDILKELHFENKIPDLNDLLETPVKFLKADKNIAAVALSTNFINLSSYLVKDGISLKDNSDFFEEVLKELPELVDFNEKYEIEQININGKKHNDLYDTRKKRDKSKRRKLIKNQLGSPLRWEIIYENEDIKNRLINEILDILELDKNTNGDLYTSPELEVEIITRKEGKILAPLCNEEETKKSYKKAFNKRVTEIQEKFDKEDITTLSLIELRNVGGEKGFKKAKDPKKAIRKGLTQRNRLSQFITPLKDDEKEVTKKNRINSAVWDLLRQSGYVHSMPKVTLQKKSKTTPDALNLFGFYLINKRRKYSDDIRFPIVVSAKTDSYEIKVKYPGSNNEWKCYSNALLDIANNTNGSGYYLNDEKINNFLFKVFNKEIIYTKNPVLIADSSNMGSVWKWINNYMISKETINFGRTHKKRMDEINDLRIIRVNSEHDPKWFGDALNENKIDYTTGIFKFNKNRFWIIPPKTQTLRKYIQSESKLDFINKPYKKARLLDVYPVRLLNGDKNEEWVKIIYLLKSISTHYDYQTKLPAPLHHASKIEEYIFS